MEPRGRLPNIFTRGASCLVTQVLSVVRGPRWGLPIFISLFVRKDCLTAVAIEIVAVVGIGAHLRVGVNGPAEEAIS